MLRIRVQWHARAKLWQFGDCPIGNKIVPEGFNPGIKLRIRNVCGIEKKAEANSGLSYKYRFLFNDIGSEHIEQFMGIHIS
jgi:hypothetical protein